MAAGSRAPAGVMGRLRLVEALLEPAHRTGSAAPMRLQSVHLPRVLVGLRRTPFGGRGSDSGYEYLYSRNFHSSALSEKRYTTGKPKRQL